ncbi:hypothetical protein ABZ793_12060 [Micromonospora sp. NPDC047465]|uniref:hypothetical protein n=1 Tax=Micromonospora sp. NPDC047465 TaxID=3154813 RepID=UPI0034111039
MTIDHPGDAAARNALARRLRGIRETAGISQWALADALDITGSGTSDLEHRRNWKVATVQAWTRALGFRLDMSIDGLTVPDDGDALAALYAAQQPTSAAAEDRLDLRTIVNNLARIRRAQDVTLAELGARLGCSESAACRRETHPDRLMLPTLQAHVRALGGVLILGLAYVPTAVAA